MTTLANRLNSVTGIAYHLARLAQLVWSSGTTTIFYVNAIVKSSNLILGISIQVKSIIKFIH